jgi:hypothetical protein
MNIPPTETTPAPAACPRCSAPHAPGQEYCLECGDRLPGGVAASLATGWRRHFRWYPGDWIWPALVSLLVTAIATGAVVAATWKSGGGSTIVATGPASRATTTTTAGLTAPTAPTEPAQPPPPPPPPNGLIAWPAGRSAFTVVLESIPATNGRAAALAKARAALRAGLKDVGVLDSSQYPSLHAGYFVVFSGIYASNVDATSAASSAKASGFADAYPVAITS